MFKVSNHFETWLKSKTENVNIFPYITFLNSEKQQVRVWCVGGLNKIALSAWIQHGDLIAAGTKDNSLESGNIQNTAQRVRCYTSFQIRVWNICAGL